MNTLFTNENFGLYLLALTSLLIVVPFVIYIVKKRIEESKVSK